MDTAKKKELVYLFSQGLILYKKKNFKNALEKFKAALKIDPTDGPAKIYIERCQIFIKDPPADDWDGVWTMTTK